MTDETGSPAYLPGPHAPEPGNSVPDGAAAVPDFHKHGRGYGPVMGHEHPHDRGPHEHNLDGLRWGPPQYLTPGDLE